MYHAYPIAATASFYPEAVKSGLSSGTSERPDSRLNRLCRVGSEPNYREFIAAKSILVMVSFSIDTSRMTGIFCLASSMVSFHTFLIVETLFDSQGYL
jgi:hypothetical protein